MLRGLGGNSPYLSDLALRESAVLARFVAEGADAAVATAMASLAQIKPAARRDRVAAALRQAKRQVALICALADISGQWALEPVTAALSALAEATLGLAMAHLLRAAHDAGDLVLPDPENPSDGGGFTVLGMGKLGARELNYSSDIDLVLMFDPAAPIYTERTADHAMVGFAVRIARGLVGLMEARDADGYVFRTDLRLRPDPAATPPADRDQQRDHLLRKHGPELGTRRDDQGAAGGRRSGSGLELPGRDPAVHLATRPGFRRRR